MRYRGLVAVVAALLLVSTAAMSVDAGGKRSYFFDTGITSDTDCNIVMSFSWSNFPAKSLYTAHVRVAYDTVVIQQWSETYQAGTDAFTTQNFAFSGAPVADTHQLTFTYSLINDNYRPRTVIVGEVTVPTRCPSTLD